jgi:hypothetical protein
VNFEEAMGIHFRSSNLDDQLFISKEEKDIPLYCV